MSETTDAATPLDSLFIQVWTEALSQVLGQITASEVPCVALNEAPAELIPAAASDLWIMGTCTGTLRGEMSMRLNPAVILGFAQVFMGEPAAPDVPLTSEHREAVVELFRQVAGMVATSLKARWGDVQLRLEAAPGAASWPASSTAWLRAGKEQAADALVELNLSAALTAALAAASRPDRENAAASSPATASASVSSSSSSAVSSATASYAPVPSASATAAQNEHKLELLMDVELDMTLRFGARRLLIREILDLCPGAVVELDRQVRDPVDLVLDGKLVARGEVVVIDGNYGLRVTEVMAARSD
ncbi:MAG TPA: flagellar motor switch protein FliN [Candidatus Sulfotelmatobacter sp.]